MFLNTGVHHAREWPTAEFVLEFAWEALERDGTDPRITSLLERGKLIAVPVVNPDGYDISRSLIQEQKRKNCRVNPGEIPTEGECTGSGELLVRGRPEPQLRRVLGRPGIERGSHGVQPSRRGAVVGAGDSQHARALGGQSGDSGDQQPHA